MCTCSHDDACVYWCTWWHALWVRECVCVYYHSINGHVQKLAWSHNRKNSVDVLKDQDHHLIFILGLRSEWINTHTKHELTNKLPSKHARSDSHPIQISLEALARSGPHDYAHWLASGLDLFGLNLRVRVNQNQIRPGLVLYNMVWVICGRTQPSLKVGNW